jgi:outer membrane protein assembly factor BamE
MTARYPSYPPAIQHVIDRHSVMRGMTQEQVYLSLGKPMCKKTVQDGGTLTEVWLYPPAGRTPCLDAETRVFFQEGVVTGWK